LYGTWLKTLNSCSAPEAEMIALLRDIERFEKHARYRTFSDGKSENCAEL
jgi:hypothetical protein